MDRQSCPRQTEIWEKVQFRVITTNQNKEAWLCDDNKHSLQKQVIINLSASIKLAAQYVNQKQWEIQRLLD